MGQGGLHGGVSQGGTLVLLGILFVMILLFETLYGRFRAFMPREVREAMAR